MGQLIRATSIPFKSIRFSQQARIVSNDSVDVERRKAIARHTALNTRFSSADGAHNYDYIQQINHSFVKKQTPVFPTGHHAAPAAPKPPVFPSAVPAADVESVSYVPSAALEAAAVGTTYVPPVISEPQAAYTTQRGAFEMRVAKGELSYLPPLEMTIILQYPDVEFEYLGGFQYVPPRDELSGVNMNVSI